MHKYLENWNVLNWHLKLSKLMMDQIRETGRELSETAAAADWDEQHSCHSYKHRMLPFLMHWKDCYHRPQNYTINSKSKAKISDWLIEHGFTSAPTQYRLYGRRFLQVWWPNQQSQSTEGGRLVIQTGLNLTMLTSPCYNTTTCMQLLHK